MVAGLSLANFNPMSTLNKNAVIAAVVILFASCVNAKPTYDYTYLKLSAKGKFQSP